MHKSAKSCTRKPGDGRRGATYQASVDEVEAAFRSQFTRPGLLYVDLHDWSRQNFQKDVLSPLVFANVLYQQLPGATFNIEVTQRVIITGLKKMDHMGF